MTIRRWEVLDYQTCNGEFATVSRHLTEWSARLRYRIIGPLLRPRGGEFVLVLRDRKTGKLYRLEGQEEGRHR